MKMNGKCLFFQLGSLVGEGLDFDVEAERLEFSDITCGGLLEVALVEVGFAEVSEGVAAQDVKDADEKLVGDGEGGPAAAAAGLEFMVFGLEVAAFLARGADGGVA